jgi:hypothetical protein
MADRERAVKQSRRVTTPSTALLQRCQGVACSREASRDGEQLKALYHLSAGSPELSVAPSIVHDVLGSPGEPLNASTRRLMESQLGHNFGSVRVHTDERAAESVLAVGARAYTVGHHVMFASGQFAPRSRSGRELLAHELSHVVQQSVRRVVSASDVRVEPPDASFEREAQAAGQGFERPRGVTQEQLSGTSTRTVMVQRQLGPPQVTDALDDPRMHPAGAPSAKKCGRPSWCPPGFCDPYSSESYARYRLAKDSWWLLAGIAAAVDSRVVPLWREHLAGGSAPKNLSASFAGDFERSRTTATTTTFLTEALRRSIVSTPPPFPVGVSTTTVTLASRLPAQIAALGDDSSPDQMNFNFPGEVPGNIAGGVGKDQLACPSGARPSPFNDDRTAIGDATVTKDAAGNLTVGPVIHYTVRDTIDLCPGDCGGSLEQIATVPISQFEATGIAGDVPFTVEFTVTPAPFTIPAPSPAGPSPLPPSSPPVSPPTGPHSP